MKVLRYAGLSAVLLLAHAWPTNAVVPPRQVQAIPVDVLVPFSPTPIHAEGRKHLMYELHLTNFGRSDLQLVRVDAINAGTETPLQSIVSTALASSIYEPGTPQQKDPSILLAGRRMVIFMDVTLPDRAAAVRKLRHRITFAPVKTINLDEQNVVEPAAVAVQQRPVPLLGPPLRGGCWVASHALSNSSSHRRTLIALNGRVYDAQRYAIDWIRIGGDGQAFRGNPAEDRNWSAYGADVLAVADGTVLDSHDGIPENDPTSDRKAVAINLTTVGGNHVLLGIGQNFALFYAHLQPGSIRVRVGERVRKGQVIGKVGNSGQADAPHLHMHLVAGKSALAAEGEPYEFESFTLQGHLPSLSVLTNGQGWRPATRPQLKVREMPLENAVVAFRGGSSPCVAR
jgi:murein DD-endopeptidase